jgi:hypothetical protein
VVAVGWSPEAAAEEVVDALDFGLGVRVVQRLCALPGKEEEHHILCEGEEDSHPSEFWMAAVVEVVQAWHLKLLVVAQTLK